MVSELFISNCADGFSRISDDRGSGCISASVVIVHDDAPGVVLCWTPGSVIATVQGQVGHLLICRSFCV